MTLYRSGQMQKNKIVDSKGNLGSGFYFTNCLQLAKEFKNRNIYKIQIQGIFVTQLYKITNKYLMKLNTYLKLNLQKQQIEQYCNKSFLDIYTDVISPILDGKLKQNTLAKIIKDVLNIDGIVRSYHNTKQYNIFSSNIIKNEQIITQQLNKLLSLNQVKSREQIRKERLFIHRNINTDNQDFSYLLWDTEISYQDLKKYCQKQQINKDIEKNKKKYFFKSIDENHINLFNILLYMFKINLNIYNENGYTPLHHSCRQDRIQMFKLLLNHPKIDVNIQSSNGNTPLYRAGLDNNIQIVELLLKHPKIDVNIKNKGGYSPLRIVCDFNRIQIIKLLLNHPKIDVNTKDNYGIAPLHIVCRYDITQIIKLLLNYSKIDVNIEDDYGTTPLHIACRYNKFQIVKLLLNHPKIDVNLKDEDMDTPINLTNNNQIIQLIKNHPTYEDNK